MRFADLGAVTVDGYGTLLELEDPVKPLAEALETHSIHRSHPEVAEAFAEEAAYYRPRSHLAHDPATLDGLRQECVAVFLDALHAQLDPGDFVDAFMGAIVFRPADGAVEALGVLRASELKLAVVSNWDFSLPERLETLDLLGFFDTVVTSAEAGVPKPDPAPFRLALDQLGTAAARALHIGDEPSDEQGAAAAGMRFAPAPLSSAVEALS
jgi:putative hydrolase of the HAD superfamily